MQEHEEEYQTLLKRGRELNIHQTVNAYFEESFSLEAEEAAVTKPDANLVSIDMQKHFVISTYVGPAEWWLRTKGLTHLTLWQDR